MAPRASKDFGSDLRMLGKNVMVDGNNKRISLSSDERDATANAVTDENNTPVNEDNPLVSQAYVNEKIAGMKIKGTFVEVIANIDEDTPVTIRHELNTPAIMANVWNGARQIEVDIEKSEDDLDNEIIISVGDTYMDLQVVVIGLDTTTGTPVTPPTPPTPPAEVPGPAPVVSLSTNEGSVAGTTEVLFNGPAGFYSGMEYKIAVAANSTTTDIRVDWTDCPTGADEAIDLLPAIDGDRIFVRYKAVGETPASESTSGQLVDIKA